MALSDAAKAAIRSEFDRFFASVPIPSVVDPAMVRDFGLKVLADWGPGGVFELRSLAARRQVPQAEHFRYAVRRALSYVDVGDGDQALDSFMSDLLAWSGGVEEMILLDPDRTVLGAFQRGRAAVVAAVAALGLAGEQTPVADGTGLAKRFCGNASPHWSHKFGSDDLGWFWCAVFDCMVCGAWRGEPVILVARRDLPPEMIGNWPAGWERPYANVRYCSDRPDCVAYATAAGPWRGSPCHADGGV